MIMDYIKKPNLIEGQLYYCNARNFSVGTWNGKHFVYVRNKFGQEYSACELHYDDGPPHGTVKPLSRWGNNSE